MPKVAQAWGSGVNTAISAQGPLPVGRSYGSLYISSATETVIATADVSVKALGTTTAGAVQDFTAVGNNRLRYDGRQTKKFKIDAFGSCIGGNTQVLELSIAKGGTNNETSKIQRKTGTGADVGAFATGCIIELAETEYVELFVANNTTNANMTITLLNLTVTEV